MFPPIVGATQGQIHAISRAFVRTARICLMAAVYFLIRLQLLIEPMIKTFIYSALMLEILSGCNGIKTLEGRAKPVYFTADSIIFTDTLFPVQTLSYRNLLGLGRVGVELNKGAISKTFICKPTFFRKDYEEFLVYPGEHIFINGNNVHSDYTFTTVNRKKRRDDELLVLKTFQKNEKYPEAPRLAKYNLATILKLEAQQKDKIVKAQKASQQFFDSLCKAYNVRKKFRRLTKDYIKNRYDFSILSIYQLYRDTLLAHNLYWNKLKLLLPAVNGITNMSQFTLSIEEYSNELYSGIFPNSGIWSMKDETDFQKYFDSVKNNFTGLARDYLLSRIMYRASVKGVKIPNEYFKKYRECSINKKYRKIVHRARREQQRNNRKTKILPNELLLVNGKTKIKLEKVLEQCKGKYVLIDLWASWCAPCMREMPYLKQLEQKYPKEKIAFINISLDKETYAWHSGIYKAHGDSSTNYLLLNSDRTSIAKQIRLVAIPRFLLYDKEGKLVNQDAPWPSDPQLTTMIDKYLKNK